MKCPTDDTVLQLAEHRTIEIDHCPSCRGVWLDPGELDEVVDLAMREERARASFDDLDDRHLRLDIRSWDDAGR